MDAFWHRAGATTITALNNAAVAIGMIRLICTHEDIASYTVFPAERTATTSIGGLFQDDAPIRNAIRNWNRLETRSGN